MAEESARVIEGKFTQSRRRRGFKYYFKWTVFILLVIAILGCYAWYKLNNDLRQNYTNSKIQRKPFEGAKPSLATTPTENKGPQADIIPQAQAQNPEDLNKVKSGMADLEARVQKLERRDDDLTIYLAVIDLKNSLNNAENFKLALEELQNVAGDMPEFSGRLDILQQASDNGLVTPQKLAVDLQKLKQQIKNSSGSFGENVKNVFSDLIKVTKISGEVDKTDHNSIIKRAELRLAKGNLTVDELDEMIKEMQNIGKPADDFVRETNNLKRVLEETNSLAATAKQRLSE